MEKNNFIFVTTDPLGRRVSLKADTWVNHIKEKHGEDISIPELIKSNIEQPRYIIQNVKPEYDGSDVLIVDPNRQDYYDLIPGDERFYILKTIVEFSNENENVGTIVTTYLLRRANEIKTTGGIVYDGKQNKSSK
jgi:hypothetical protein